MNCFHCKNESISCSDHNAFDRLAQTPGAATIHIRLHIKDDQYRTFDTQRADIVDHCPVHQGKMSIEEFLPSASQNQITRDGTSWQWTPPKPTPSSP